MAQLIRETEQLKYRVVDANGRVLLAETHSLHSAERYLETLPQDIREGANIFPITTEGKQILHG